MRSITEIAAGGWLFLALAALANIAANSSLRQAAQGIKGREGPVNLLLGLMAQPVFWLGLGAAGLLLLAFTLALREMPVSLAYPIVTSLAIAGLLFVDYALFGQAIGGLRLLGVALIAVGVAIVFVGAPDT